MEVRSCKINNSFYRIWFEANLFNREDIEDKKNIQISLSQLRWFVEVIHELLQSPNCFYLKNGRDDFEATRLSKFRSNSGWVLRCVVWPTFDGRFYIHVHSVVSYYGWKSFVEMMSGFLRIQSSNVTYGFQITTPTISSSDTINTTSYSTKGFNPSYVDVVKKNLVQKSFVLGSSKQSIKPIQEVRKFSSSALSFEKQSISKSWILKNQRFLGKISITYGLFQGCSCSMIWKK